MKALGFAHVFTPTARAPKQGRKGTPTFSDMRDQLRYGQFFQNLAQLKPVDAKKTTILHCFTDFDTSFMVLDLQLHWIHWINFFHPSLNELLMEDIPNNHMGRIKPCKLYKGFQLPTSTGYCRRISGCHQQYHLDLQVSFQITYTQPVQQVDPSQRKSNQVPIFEEWSGLRLHFETR